MPVYVIYADPNDGHILSLDKNYQTSRMGNGSFKEVVTNAQEVKVGQNFSSDGYWTYQGFFSFATEVIPDAEEIVDAHLNIHSGWTGSRHATFWGQRFYLRNWTAPLTAAQWVNPTGPVDLLCNFDWIQPTTPWMRRSTAGAELVDKINKFAPTKMVSIANNTIAGGNVAPIEMWVASGESTLRPYLAVYTTVLSTMNVVELAATTLPDGTTISVRSNGAAVPTLTLGYQPITGSWTSIGAVHNAFTKTIDGENSLTIVPDPQGNFFVVGADAGTRNLVAQGYQRTSPTSWTGRTPLRQAPPAGNKEPIRSVAGTYMGGTGANDRPFVRLIVARGASGVNPDIPNHVFGAGWAHDIALNPVSLLQGAGELFLTAANGFWQGYGFNTTGVPVFVDTVNLTQNLSAMYLQRGKMGNQEVGGLYVFGSIDAVGRTVSKSNQVWVPTNSSKLVPISGNKFAHVFDEDGRYLRIVFYNAQAQTLGGATINAESFYQGVIGRAWSAHYDSVSDLVRVHYVNSTGAGRALDRVDVSATTYASTTVPNVTTTLGAVGSVNTVLRVSDNADERRIAIDSSNLAAGVLSTQTYFSTAGNIAPTAPLTVTRTAFDATQPADFKWEFSDRNPKDTQSAYEVEISRTSDAVVMRTTGKVTSTATTYTLPAVVLQNETGYRWRVRLYDTVGDAGVWSPYQNFQTSATGSVSIDSPATDNLGGIETASVPIRWTYSGAQGKRQIRAYQVSGNILVHDSGMVATGSNEYTVPGLLSDIEYRIEVSLINTAGISVPSVSRFVTPKYALPMIPEMQLYVGDSFIEILVSNPIPTGDRPEVMFNDIYRRVAKSTAVESDFIRIGTTNTNGVYRDYATKSATQYEYRVTGRSSD